MSRRNKLLMRAVRRLGRKKRARWDRLYLASEVSFWFRGADGEWKCFDGALKSIEYTEKLR